MANENEPSVSVQPLAWWFLPEEGGPLDHGPLDILGKLRKGWPPIGETVLVQGPEGRVAFRLFEVDRRPGGAADEAVDVWIGVADEQRHPRPSAWALPFSPDRWPAVRHVLRHALGLPDEPERGRRATGRNYYTTSKGAGNYALICEIARAGFLAEGHEDTFHVTPAGQALVVLPGEEEIQTTRKRS